MTKPLRFYCEPQSDVSAKSRTATLSIAYKSRE
jgi:hypothetical protein